MNRHAELVEKAHEVMYKYLPVNAVERLTADIIWGEVKAETLEPFTDEAFLEVTTELSMILKEIDELDWDDEIEKTKEWLRGSLMGIAKMEEDVREFREKI